MKELKPKIKKFIVFMDESLHRDLKVGSAQTGKAMNLIVIESLRKELKTILK